MAKLGSVKFSTGKVKFGTAQAKQSIVERGTGIVLFSMSKLRLSMEQFCDARAR